MLYESVFIVLAAVFIALVVNALRPDGIDLFNRQDTAVLPMYDGPARLVGIDDAIQKFSRKNGIFVDARTPDDFDQGHIPGAVNLPDYLFDDRIEDFMTRFDSHADIITYCSGIDCHQAMDLAEKLCFAGFENVSYYADGMQGWIEKNMPVQTDRDNAMSR